MNKTIYVFEVRGCLESGKTVYMVDMKNNTIREVNRIYAEEFVRIITEVNPDHIFYTDVEEEIENEHL